MAPPLGSRIKVSFFARAGEPVTAEVCRTDTTRSRGWRKRWCAWAVGPTRKVARKRAIKAFLRKMRSRR